MVLRETIPAEGCTQFMYQFVWNMDKEHCLFFMDAIISSESDSGGAIGDVFYSKKDSEDRIGVMKMLEEYAFDIFELFAEIEAERIGLVVRSGKLGMERYFSRV